MVDEYYHTTEDIVFLKTSISLLEKEYKFWMTNRTIEIDIKGVSYLLNSFRADTFLPRPGLKMNQIQI
jgi:alpha,alpha-trehalase